MRELADLARTAGAEVVGSDVQRRSDVDPAHFIGMGKVAERFVIILDIARVLSIEELAAVAAAGDEAPSGSA